MDTVYLVDDDPAVLRALARVLGEAGWQVETFESAEAFLARGEREAGRCLVLDVTMPGLDGLALQRRLSEEGLAMPIIFLTGQGDIPMSVQAIKAGATDFLTKPVSSQALVSAVRAAIEHGAFARKAQADIQSLKDRLATLTAREREVLAALVQGKLNKQIAGELGIVEQTVKFHRSRLMERMQARTLAELMHIAATLGISAQTSAARNKD
jgi:FixJ family two-component response regulator